MREFERGGPQHDCRGAQADSLRPTAFFLSRYILTSGERDISCFSYAIHRVSEAQEEDPMRAALRGRGTRHDDQRPHHDLPKDGGRRRPEPMHLTLRTQPHPFG